MPNLEAQIETERAGRYLVQFCKHAASMGGGGHTPRMHLHAMVARREVQVAAEWSDTSGTVTFTPWGRCILTAEARALAIRIDAADDDGLAQIRDVVTRDFARFSQRDPLTPTWQQADDQDAAPVPRTAAAKDTHRRGGLLTRTHTILLALAVILVVGLHIGLAGTTIANSRWTATANNLVGALVLLKIALIVLARLGIRRRKTAKTADPS